MEVAGFGLDNVPAAPLLETPNLPWVVPMLYHSAARSRAPTGTAVAMSLYEVIGKKTPIATRQALLEKFKLSDDTTIILTGTDDDRPLERWWKAADRQPMLRTLAALGVKLVTTPNFSLFNDVPRHDNLYNMKRIAKVWSEIQNEGLLCAPHLNARTDKDWERWLEFLKSHSEIECVAFEFGTGAGSKSRIEWHLEQLQRLTAEVGRPLHLIVRGGMAELGALGAMFAGLTFVDTSAFMRAQKRWRITMGDGRLGYERSPTLQNQPIDDLLDSNIQTINAYVAHSLLSLEAAHDARQESGYLHLLSQSRRHQRGRSAIDREGVIAAAETQ